MTCLDKNGEAQGSLLTLSPPLHIQTLPVPTPFCFLQRHWFVGTKSTLASPPQGISHRVTPRTALSAFTSEHGGGFLVT